MSIESEIAGLTQATTNLLNAVNIRKAELDKKVGEATEQAALAETNGAEQVALAAAQVALASTHENRAAASASAATTKSGESASYAAQALAIYGSVAAQQTAVAQAVAQASLAAGYAASAASVVQQDLSGMNTAALHRSPNAVIAMFVYDTSKDSDGGAWTERCQGTSWYNEPINGKWLGAHTSEAAARAVSGATTGDYFQLTTDGRFFKLNATSGTTEVFRGNKRDFPRLAAILVEASSVNIYDLTEPGLPMWMRFNTGTSAIYNIITSNVAVKNGLIYVGGSTYLSVIDFAKDAAGFQFAATKYRRVILSERNAGSNTVFKEIISQYPLGGQCNTIDITVLTDASVDAVTGLKVPTIAIATSLGISVINDNGIVRSDTSLGSTMTAVFDSSGNLYFSRGAFNVTLKFSKPITYKNNANFGANFAIGAGATNNAVAVNIGTVFCVTKRGQIAGYSQVTSGYSRLGAGLFNIESSGPQRSLTAHITNTYNTGHMTGDIRRVYMADVGAGSVSNPSTVADRSYKAALATVVGTLTKSAVASAAELVAYSGFSAANYLQESYSADLDFGTGEWSCSALVNVPTGNAAAGTIASRAHSSGAYITLGIDATNKLTATAFDGTTARIVTTSVAYNTAAWLKVRASYTIDGTLAILVNSVEAAATRGNPLLTLNNSNAVLTIGNSYALDAPFPGSIALLKFSATVPTTEQSAWMYEQEKQMFRGGAQVCLPDSGVIVDMTYNDATDKWIAISATNESEWAGLVRTSVTPVPAGSYSKAAAASGVQLLARSTTNPGVDVTIPAYGLREELVKRAESAARLNAQLATYDYVGGLTANTTNGSTAITNVTGLTYPVSAKGARISGSGIPANTTIVDVVGTTVYLSAATTATATGVQISFQDFILPVGMEAKAVLLAGVAQREGSTAQFTRLFDGFKEAIRLGTVPAHNANIQIQAARSAA